MGQQNVFDHASHAPQLRSCIHDCVFISLHYTVVCFHMCVHGKYLYIAYLWLSLDCHDSDTIPESLASVT